jgi:hypothetical protein
MAGQVANPWSLIVSKEQLSSFVPHFLTFGQLFKSRQIYHQTHISHVWADWFKKVGFKSYFTILLFGHGSSEKYKPILLRELCTVVVLA